MQNVKREKINVNEYDRTRLSGLTRAFEQEDLQTLP